MDQASKNNGSSDKALKADATIKATFAVVFLYFLVALGKLLFPMSGLTKVLCCLVVLICCGANAQQTSNPLLEKGWEALVKDHENDAFGYFFEAYQKAQNQNNTADKAESLLYLGICSFGSSPEKGLQYATQSLAQFKKLETTHAKQAKIGRGKCLQLISTIYSRQKKYARAVAMSREVVQLLQSEKDPSGTLGLAYSSLGTLYLLQQKDSAAYFFRMALQDFKKNNNVAYLPNAYLKIGELYFKKDNKQQSAIHFNKAKHIADSTQNRQAQVSSLLAIGNWHQKYGQDQTAENQYQSARKIAATLSDKSFEIKAIEALVVFLDKKGNFEHASRLQKELLDIKDRFYSLEREQIAKSLEVQFEISEKDRQLALVSKEKEVSRLTNILLAICLLVLAVVFSIGYFFLKRLNHRDKQLLRAKEALVEALEKEDPLHILDVDNEMVRKQQVERLANIKQTRNNDKVSECLEALTNCAQTSKGNLLELAVEAARNRATLGEISDALETVFGRYKAQIKSFSGVYSKEIKNDESFEKAKQLADAFAQKEGRRPRIMIAKMGQDGHDRGAKVVATGYADVGFDVDIGPLFQTPAEAAKQAMENDVHILGVSSLAAGHKTLVPQVIEELRKYGREDIMVIVGGVIPAQDYQYLFDAGAVAVFGPGTKISEAAIRILDILLESFE
jgi:methylmalonyl-CoA mutase cobalamin-binding domain/chain